MLVACHRHNKALEGHYFTSSNNRVNINPDEENINMGPYLASENFMDFFNNGTYTMYLNKFENGMYRLVDDTIELNPSLGHPWKLRYIEDGKVGHFEFPNAGKISTLKKLENHKQLDYPFTSELNQWRINKRTTLSNNELIEKFQNYCAFMAAYMRWAKNNDQRLSFKQVSGPLQYANNGLMMRKLSDTRFWCSYFVEGDCERMDKILRLYFDGLVIDWKHTHNRIAMLIDALDQVSKGIENHKENFTN